MDGTADDNILFDSNVGSNEKMSDFFPIEDFVGF